MKRDILPIPVEEDINAAVRRGAEATGLKLADVMRQGLRHGVPAFVQRLRTANAERPARCLDYLDEYPRSPIPAKEYKLELRKKLARKYDRTDR
ncbi:MAG TPA: hypothetical protein PLP42_10695 [Acidobacteriota bacterium]|nr:hypothetical protein [Acidobacteriota bacterium]